MPAWLLAILTAVVTAILKKVSQSVKDAKDDFLDKLEAKADETRNTIDNMFVDFLRELLQGDKDDSD